MTELDRILALERPATAPPTLPAGLRPVQVEALTEWTRALSSSTEYGPPGLAVLAGCGHGKTLIALLLPAVARAALGTEPRALYLVPSALQDQFRADAGRWTARGYSVPSEEKIRVESHERLSSPTGRWLLGKERPDLIVVDEAHGFCDPESGRWRRVTEYLRTAPNTRVVVMSGSLSWRSLRQARHLLLAALRGWCPLPADRSLDHWAAVIDVKSEPCADDHRALRPLVQWAWGEGPYWREYTPSDLARQAYRDRLRTCPGLVLSSESGCAASLRIHAWAPSISRPTALEDALRGLEERWELPDGTELTSALEYARHAATLPFGLYQRWKPDTVVPAWVEARRAWAREVRTLVTYAGGVYQTPGAVEAFAAAGKLDARRLRVYRAWKEAEAAHPEPETEAVWLEGARDYVRAVVYAYAGRLAVSCSPYLVWTRTPELGRAVAEALDPAEYHGAGSSPPTGRPAVVSYLVHGTGWDGAVRAGYRHGLVLEPPASGATWEQLLARLHRPPQTEDVEWTVYAGSRATYAALNSAVADARYVVQTTGAPQRLLYADWVGFSGAR